MSYKSSQIQLEDRKTFALDAIIHAGDSSELFKNLVDKYLLRTTVGVSGVQPKVVVPETRGTLALPSLIVKSGNADYPNIAFNEFLCLSIAREAGLSTPNFWVSDDFQLFIMRRFDILETGERLGMEDFSVLMGKLGDKKYEARYETLLRAADLYQVDVTEMFEQIVVSLILGNGDAHLKNFAILYTDLAGPFHLSPLYDVVCTRAYGDETTALSINKSRDYPTRAYLEKLGKKAGVNKPSEIITRISNAVDTVCNRHLGTMNKIGASFVKDSICQNRDRVLIRSAFRT